MGEGRLIPRICERCSSPFLTPERGLRRGRGRFCGRPCSIAAAQDIRWERHHATVNEWLWDRMDKTGGEDACWEWKGRVVAKRRGYGRIMWHGRLIGAHRLALILSKGEPPAPDMFACHRCDNPVCCNPSHLWWGTGADNMRDASSKGRMSSRAIIDIQRAYEMRQAGASLKEIGKEFGVHFASAGKAVKRALRARAHLEGE